MNTDFHRWGGRKPFVLAWLIAALCPLASVLAAPPATYIPRSTDELTEATDKHFVSDAQLVTLGNTSGTNTGDQTSVSGNAGTATALQTARTINGTSFDGTANITLGAAAGTLTGNTLASGVTGSSLTSAAGGSFGTAAFTAASAYEVPLTFSQSLSRSTNTITLSGDSASPGNSKLYGTNGSGTKGWYDQPAGGGALTLTGEASGSGTGSISVTLSNAAVIGKVLTGYVSGAGTIAATDSVLEAIQKLNGNLAALSFSNIGGTIAIGQIPTGTTGSAVALGNDARFSDARAPNGSAGGDLTGFYPNPTIASAAVTLGKMANMATSSLIYRKTASAGAPEVNTLATLKTDLGLTGTNSGDQTSVTGNAGTATALQTARTINGTSFDGTANVTVTAAAGTLTGNTLASGVTGSSLTSAAGGSFGTAAFTAASAYEVPLTFSQSLSRSTNMVTLSGDSAAPGNSKLYGTNVSGVKGWYDQPLGGAGSSPGGSTTQVQFNDAGAFGGDADFAWDKTTKTLTLGGADTDILLKGITTEPAAPAAGLLAIYSKAVSGRMMLKTKGPSGLDFPLQPALFGNNVVLYVPNTGTTGGINFGTPWAVGPTIAHPQPTAGIYTQIKRTTSTNVVTTTNQLLGVSSIVNTAAQFWRGNAAAQGGFFFFARFGIETLTDTNPTNTRLFVGLQSGTTNILASDTIPAISCIGLWHDTTDGADVISLLTKNGTTATKNALTGAPITPYSTVQAYDFYMFAKPNDTVIYYRLDNMNTGATLVDSSVNTTLPLSTTFMGTVVGMSNGTANIVAAKTGIGVNRIYVESDH